MRHLIERLESAVPKSVTLYVGLVLDAQTEANRLKYADKIASMVPGFKPDREHHAHVTLLYAKVKAKHAKRAAQLVSSVLKSTPAPDVFANGFGYFPGGADGVPLYVEVHKEKGIQEVADKVLRAVAHLIVEPVRDEYRPHITLGYLNGTLSADDYFRISREWPSHAMYPQGVDYEVTTNGATSVVRPAPRG